MPTYAASQISKPIDGQAFERSCRVLWKCLLDDPNVMENGRSGQKQAGVDLWGYRNQDKLQLVGIQCKLKADGVNLKAREVQREIDLALNFTPSLKEYFIVTTAPDDERLQNIARIATAAQRAAGRDIAIHVWGWGAMQARIAEHLDAAKAFDPSYGVFGQALLAGQVESMASQAALHEKMAAMGTMLAQLASSVGIVQAGATRSAAPDDATSGASSADQALDAQIDEYRDIMVSGQPRTALGLLERLLTRVGNTASGRIVFRIKANAGSCRLLLNDVVEGAKLFIEAHSHAPHEPKAVANKAFGLLLLDRFEEVLELGNARLTDDPVHEALAGFVIMAAMRIPGIDDPMGLIPASLRSLPNVEAAAVDILRMRGVVPEWWEAARSALGRHPNDDRLLIYVAEADLDEVTRSATFLASGVLDDEQREQLRAAAKALRSSWDEARSGERVVRPEMAALCCNTTVALHLVEENAAARVVVEQGLEAYPGDREVLLRAAQLAVEAGFEDLAKRVLPQIGDEPAALMFRFIHASHVGDWEAVRAIGEGDIEAIPETERNMVAIATRLAPIKLGLEERTPERLQNILDEARDARSAIVFANIALQWGEKGLAGVALDKAIALVSEASHASSKKMVAVHAARTGRWDIVSYLLEGAISLQHDSPELRWLAAAYANDIPVREAAITFFSHVEPALLARPYYIRAVSLMNYNRGELDAARDWAKKLIELEPNCAFAQLIYLMAVHRKGDLDLIRDSIAKIDTESVEGDALDRVSLAGFMAAFGRHDDALAYAYSVYRANRNNAHVASRFAGLVISGGQLGEAYHPEKVQQDCWVKLTEKGGDTCEFIVAHAGELPVDGIFGADHPLVVGSTGLSVGGVFTQKLAFERMLEWTVMSYQHRILHAARDILENYEHRFPGVPGVYKLTVDPEQGLPPELIENSRQREEAHRRAADLYSSHLLPIALLAHHLGTDPITFGHHLQSLDVQVNASIGTLDEWRANLSVARRARERGVVLDAYTAWVAAETNILDIIKKLTGRVVVPRSVIDYAQAVAGRHDGPIELAVNVRHRNGEPVLTLLTQEELGERKRLMSSRVDKILNTTEIVAVTAPSRPKREAIYITENWGAHALDPAYVAASHNLVLLSDDLVYRRFAKEACGVSGTWLHALLALSFEDNIIDITTYSNAIVELALRGHSHVFLETSALIEVLRQDDSADLCKFAAVSRYVGMESADLASHIKCVAHFLDTLWKEAVPWTRQARATHHLLCSLVRHLKGEREWTLRQLQQLLGQNKVLSKYLLWWSWLHRTVPATCSDAYPFSWIVASEEHGLANWLLPFSFGAYAKQVWSCPQFDRL